MFIVSGGEKLIVPYQNFLYVIQNYAILPDGLDVFTARVFPWVELFLGLFVAAGLWLRVSLFGVLGMLTVFIAVVGQAIVRKLPITECGCFGELLSFPLPVVLAFDCTLFLIVILILTRFSQASRFSCDKLLG